MLIIWDIIIAAFLLTLVDSAAGMGFGTAMTPLLFLLGYHPLEVVPVLLVSQTITGVTAALFHHEFENIRFSFFPLNKATKLMLLLAGIGCCSILVSVFLTYFKLKPPESIVQAYVSLLLVMMGIIGLLTGKRKKGTFKPKQLIGFAALAGFNKGVGAGGYGPVLTLGQVSSGIYEKSAVGIVSFAESVVSLAGAISFFVFGGVTDFALLPSVFSGSFFAAALSTYIVRVLPNKTWKFVIPFYSFIIGVIGLLKLLLI